MPPGASPVGRSPPTRRPRGGRAIHPAIWADTLRAEELLGWRATRSASTTSSAPRGCGTAATRTGTEATRVRSRAADRGGGMIAGDGLTVAYVMSRFPKLTETFILAELEAMDRAGVRIELHPLLRQTGEPVQPAAERWVERAHYLPFLSPAILRGQLVFLRDRSRRRRYLRAFADMIGGTWRSPNFLLGGLGIFPKVARMSIGDARPSGSITSIATSRTTRRSPAGSSIGWSGSRTASRRTAPTCTSTGRCWPTKVDEAAFVVDDLGGQPQRDRGDGRADAPVRQGRRSSIVASIPTRSRRSDRATSKGRCGSSRSGRSTRSRARST